MAEYIEREAALALFDERKWQGEVCQIAIGDLPAADVAPVRHGNWVQTHPRDTVFSYECSVCGGVVDPGDFSYCPNCGAKMDGRF